jgi:hypothetical protein
MVAFWNIMSYWLVEGTRNRSANGTPELAVAQILKLQSFSAHLPFHCSWSAYDPNKTKQKAQKREIIDEPRETRHFLLPHSGH